MKLKPRLKSDIGLNEIIASWITRKNSITVFETEFAKKFNNPFGIMFPHGRSGLYSLFKIWGLENDEIICPAYTCVVVQHAIVFSKNIPVFVDCAQDNHNMDLALLEKEITTKTRCIVATHLWGVPMDVVRLQEIVTEAEKKYGHKIYVVQDCAHSFGCKWNGKLVTEYGDASLFGLNISKMITSVFGGMILLKSEADYQNLLGFRKKEFEPNLSRKWKMRVYLIVVWIAFNKFIYRLINFVEKSGLINAFTKYFDAGKIDMPNDWKQIPTNVEASVGLVQLEKYEQRIESKISNTKKWINDLASNDSIKFINYPLGSTCSHCIAEVEDRNMWVKNYEKKGIQLGILIEYSVPELAAYQGYKKREYPRANWLKDHCINFPNW